MENVGGMGNVIVQFCCVHLFVHLLEGNGLKVFPVSVPVREIQPKVVTTFARKTYECSPGRVGISWPSSDILAAAVTAPGLQYVSDGQVPNNGSGILSERPPQVSPTPVEIGAFTLTTVETNKASRMAENVNRILMRGAGGVEPAGVENAGKSYSTSSFIYRAVLETGKAVFAREEFTRNSRFRLTGSHRFWHWSSPSSVP